ncbi:MAG TPA: diiron oxygenase [Verrucomicrobiae bacterium]|jgi:hypothetical protein|nr:diiron oxygenase [Verrucomicrobiae bacterium]
MNNCAAPPIVERPVTDAVDFSRLFMPEILTPLYHTSAYRSLTDRQRLRYNQLNALYFNEQIMFFEKALARNVLGYFQHHPLPAELKLGLRQFALEEERHTAMFLELNRRCSSSYQRRDFYFIRIPPAGANILEFMSNRPLWFPLLLWLMHLQEERALFFGRVFLRFQDELEPNFVSVQRRHLADEVGHVRWDERLLAEIWPKTGIVLRHVNVRMLIWMIDEYFSVPKRSSARVVEALIEEFEELRPKAYELRRQLGELGSNAEYRRLLYSVDTVPNSLAKFDLWPEFKSLKRRLSRA